MTVFKVDNQLRSKLCTKPADKESFLQSKSEHPWQETNRPPVFED